MAAAGARETATVAALRSVRKAATPTGQHFGAVVSELQLMQMVGEGSIFERGAQVPVTHMAFFKPPATAFLSEPKAKDRQSAKERENINAAGVWLELGKAEMALAKDGEMTLATTARMLALADKAFATAREVLAMRADNLAIMSSVEWKGPERWPSWQSRATTPYTRCHIARCVNLSTSG
jgi:hypothetical protein